MSIEDAIRTIIREEITGALANHKERDNNELPFLMDAKDVSRVLRCSLRSAYSVMEEKDFPLLRIGKMKRVKREDFLVWLNKNK